MVTLLDLPATLERWGLTVVPVTGWQDRKRPGPFAPIGVLIHHTAAARGKDAPSLQLCIDGPRDLPGPLCQLMVARSGKVYVISRGRCNHAGEGGPLYGHRRTTTLVDRDQGNAMLVGIELENDGVGEPWPDAQVQAAIKATAVVLDLLGNATGAHCWAHREYAPNRKTDPKGIDMDAFRTMVSLALLEPPGATTMPTLTENDPGARIQRAINANGLQPPLKIDGKTGELTADGLDQVLTYLNGQIADLRKANATSADTIVRLGAERDFHMTVATDAQAQREAAETEALQLRRQLQEGGRLPQLLADLDEAVKDSNIAHTTLTAAIAKARA